MINSILNLYVSLPEIKRSRGFTSHYRYCSLISFSVSWMSVSFCVFNVVLYCSPNKHNDFSIKCNLKLQGVYLAIFRLVPALFHTDRLYCVCNSTCEVVPVLNMCS